MAQLASTMDSLEQVQNHLDRWKGHIVLLHAYSSSHPVLEIALTDRAFKRGIMIWCYTPRHIRAPVGWPSGDFLVEHHDDGRLGYHVLRDEKAGAEIACEDVAIEPLGHG